MTRRWRWALMGSLLATSAWLALFGDKTPPGSVTPPVSAARAPATQPAAPALARPGSRPVAPPPAIDALQPRQAQPDAGDAPMADLFGTAAWRAPPPPPPARPAVAVTPVAEPTPVPPHPYRLIGKKLEAEVWEVFLGRGETSFIVRAGDTLEGAWAVERIDPPTLMLTHLSSGRTQAMDIGVPP